ncbi:MAG: hypothetical protein D6785_01550, partial [Planctomycetota bacterium]
MRKSCFLAPSLERIELEVKILGMKSIFYLCLIGFFIVYGCSLENRSVSNKEGIFLSKKYKYNLYMRKRKRLTKEQKFLASLPQGTLWIYGEIYIVEPNLEDKAFIRIGIHPFRMGVKRGRYKFILFPRRWITKWNRLEEDLPILGKKEKQWLLVKGDTLEILEKETTKVWKNPAIQKRLYHLSFSLSHYPSPKFLPGLLGFSLFFPSWLLLPSLSNPFHKKNIKVSFWRNYLQSFLAKPLILYFPTKDHSKERLLKEFQAFLEFSYHPNWKEILVHHLFQDNDIPILLAQYLLFFPSPQTKKWLQKCLVSKVPSLQDCALLTLAGLGYFQVIKDLLPRWLEMGKGKQILSALALIGTSKSLELLVHHQSYFVSNYPQAYILAVKYHGPRGAFVLARLITHSNDYTSWKALYELENLFQK